MIERYIQIDKELDSSIFLFGPRQTGKSTALRRQFPDSIMLNLLDTELRDRLRKRPGLLYVMLSEKPEGTIVIIDEIQEVPELLNEVQRLISERGLRFILCGSSARKLKRKDYDTLGVRAIPCRMYPLVSAELKDFDLDKALINGLMPPHYSVKDAGRRLSAYVDVYLKEESLVRNLNSFHRFMEVAAQADGEIVNYTDIAAECGVSAQTVRSYFEVLEETLVGYMIPAYNNVMKRRLTQSPKFYFFDVGLTQYLLRRKSLVRGTPEYGHAFEHFIVQEIIAYIGYNHKNEALSYWRTHTGVDVDAVIGDAQIAIEIRSVEEVQSRHLKGLKSFAADYPSARLMVVSLDRFTRREYGVEMLYVGDFLSRLWKGEVF